MAAGVAAAAGCAGNAYSDRAAADIRSDPTPELETRFQRPVDRWNMAALVNDTNLRDLNSDWDRFWLLDKSSSLAPGPRLR